MTGSEIEKEIEIKIKIRIEIKKEIRNRISSGNLPGELFCHCRKRERQSQGLFPGNYIALHELV